MIIVAAIALTGLLILSVGMARAAGRLGVDEAICANCGWRLPDSSPDELNRRHVGCPRCEDWKWV